MAYIDETSISIIGSADQMAVSQALLDEAEAALHALATGTALVEFRDQNGEVMKYNQASRTGLIAYIADLKRQLGLLPGSGPMRVWF